MTQATAGSCLCGAVKFQITGEFESFFLCHCSRCRKDTGSAHAANLFSSSATVNWLSGQESIRNYRVPESRHERSFCTNCGSAVPSMQMEGALLVVPAGSIDSAVTLRPSAHICFGDRAEWDTQLEGVPKIDGLPG